MDILGFRIHRLARTAPAPLPDLSGDRQVEWMYVAARIGRLAGAQARVLDFGCGAGWLSLAAGSLGVQVLAIDLLAQQFENIYPNITFQKTDVMDLDERSEPFDLVINCSSIEHVGLSGRYGAREAPDGDLQAMQKMRRLLRPGGYMLLTLPIGRDAVFPPLHRVFGRERFPRLIEGFSIIESTFWHKDRRNIWLQCPAETAMAEPGSDHYYGLGCLVLQATGASG